MFLGAGVVIVGAIVQATSRDLAAFMIGRFLLGEFLVVSGLW